jgi:hypothetical protein
MQSTFITSEIVSYLFEIGETAASKAFEQDAQTKTVKHQYVSSWFQLYFGREESHKLFREMETKVAQNLLHYLVN